MLDLAKNILLNLKPGETKVSFAGFGLYDDDIVALKDLLEAKMQLTEIDFTRNNMRAKAAEVLASLPSLVCIHAGQNSLGDRGAQILLAKKNLTLLDLENNGITYEIADLIAQRSEQGVKIFTSGNPRLNPKYPDSYVNNDLLEQQSHKFRTFERPKPSCYSWAGLTAIFGYGKEPSTSGTTPVNPSKNYTPGK